MICYDSNSFKMLLYTSKNHFQTVDFLLPKSLWGNFAYRQSNCVYRKINGVPPYGLTLGKNSGYANISSYRRFRFTLTFFHVYNFKIYSSF